MGLKNPDKKTMIEITKVTRTILQELRLCKRESYDEVINRLVKEHGKEIYKV